MRAIEIEQPFPGPYAPIALFVYNRPFHTRRTIEALAANKTAALSNLYVFSDAPKDHTAIEGVAEVRSLIREIKGFAKVTLIERDANKGLAESIIDGVTKLNEEYGRVIVLEDDLITSPFFLNYMNDALTCYDKNDEVASISGYIYPLHFSSSEDIFFARLPQSWGWATWKRAWELFDSDGQYLLNELINKKSIKQFDKSGAHSYLKMLKDQIKGKNNSWYVRWHASTFLEQKLHLMPCRSLVKNIGIDGSGVHCAHWKYDPFDVDLSMEPIQVKPIELSELYGVREKFLRFSLKVKLLRYINFMLRLPVIRWFSTRNTNKFNVV